MEMGIPGLPAAQIGVDGQIKALQNGCDRLYPGLPGEPMIKEAATSRFIKAFIDVDVPPECCISTVGSMQGTFASLLTIIMDTASNGEYHFRDDVIVYGQRAHKLKEIFTHHGFSIVYGMDGDKPIAYGFLNERMAIFAGNNPIV